MTETDRKRQLSLRETIGDLPLVSTDEEILLHEFGKKFFPFNFPEKSPGVLA
jgi:hypothetical protein